MMGTRHAEGGAAFWLAGCAVIHPAPLVILEGLGLAVGGAYAVDIDHRSSEVTQFLGPLTGLLSWCVRPRCGRYRGVIHSWWGVLAVALGSFVPCVFTGWPWWAGTAIMTGWVSHLALDAGTAEGLPLCWPDRTRWGWLPKRYSIITGGKRKRRGSRRRFAEVAELWVVQPVLLAVIAVAAFAIVAGVRHG